MSQSLVIVESPSKAKTIGKYLGSGYTVKASVGHVRDLPEKKLGVDVEHGFEPEYVTIKGKEKVLKELRGAAGKADRVLLAPDPDREGEAIAWHIAQALGLAGKEILRVSFNEITKSAVLEALKHPQPIDENKFNSQQARRILDRLVGYKISPLLWKKVRRGLSAGRVQSVAVRLVVEREEEIEAFKPEEYWELYAVLEAGQPPIFKAKLATKNGKRLAIGNGQEAQTIRQDLKSGAYVVQEITRRAQNKRPYPPFITSTLQQAASRRLRITPAQVMRVAQELYEGVDVNGDGPQGLITYMRTDSVRVSAQAQTAASDYVRKTYGADYVPEKPNFYRSRSGAQEAHEAIRPVSLELPPEKLKGKLSPMQLKVYDLIWRRFLASQMSPAVLDVVTVQIANGPYGLVVSEFKEIFAGHLAAMRDDEENGGKESEVKLPPLAKDQTLQEKDCELNQKFTQPPARYTEATLIKALEEKGIGRPSTYASILSTILDKKYVEKIKEAVKADEAEPANRKQARGSLKPSDLGRTVTKMLVESFPDLLDVSFTAQMEDKLDHIEDGRIEWHTLLEEFWRVFQVNLKKAATEMANIKGQLEMTDIICERCQSPMVIKYGKNGSFLGCSQYPLCKNTKNFTHDADGKVVAAAAKERPFGEEPQPSDKICPICGGPMLLRRSRKNSRFYSCAKYPKCKGTLSFETGVTCPAEGCGGMLVERSGPRGTFWGCSHYPKCRVTFRAEPVPQPCPKGNSAFLLRRHKNGGTVLSCPVRECDYEVEEPGKENQSATE